MAKKTTRKQTRKRGTPKRKTPAKRTPKRTVARRATAPKKTIVRRKTAARAAATRRRKASPTPKQPSRVRKVTAIARGVVAGAAKAVAERLPWSRVEPDAIEILEREHRQFEQWLKEGEDTTERARKTRRELLTTLTSSLNAHELMEEQVLYPALQPHAAAREVVLEGYEEHHVADLIVEELQHVAEHDEQWGAKFKVLKENIEHHIQEEERVMFPVARSVFSREQLADLAARMLAVRRGG